MAKPNAIPSHLPIVFARNIHMRREHVAGALAANEGEGLTIIVRKGEEKKITYAQAMDLLISDGGVRADRADNKERIEEIRQEAIEDRQRDEAEMRKPAVKTESIDEKIERHINRFVNALTGGKKAAA